MCAVKENILSTKKSNKHKKNNVIKESYLIETELSDCKNPLSPKIRNTIY